MPGRGFRSCLCVIPVLWLFLFVIFGLSTLGGVVGLRLTPEAYCLFLVNVVVVSPEDANRLRTRKLEGSFNHHL